MNRRTFLLVSFSSISTRLFAADPGSPRFLLVFLRGGYDAANLLVPYTSDFYYEARPTIAVPREAALKLDSDWALHPALAETIYPMYQRREVAFVPFAGSHDLSRSHFQSQDTIELGLAPDASRSYESGFMNRLAAVLGASGRKGGSIAFSQRMPLAFRGPAPVASVAIGNPNPKPPAVDARQSALIAEMYAGTPLGEQVSGGFAVRESFMKDMASEMEAANRNAVTARGFELQAQRIARLMRGEYNLGFVDVGGWDTHVNQGAGASGYFATRLEELGRGLSAFAEGMGSAWKETVVVVLSEFGRTFRENGNRGTDHGHGSVYWVLGGAVRGGRIVGQQTRVARETLHQDRDYPAFSDCRSLLGGIVSRVYGVDASQSSTVFPGASSSDIAFI